jgi:inhibitor of cysteine peptidase
MKRALATALMASTVTLACGGGASTALDVCTLSASDPAVTLRVGAEGVLCLPSNPTTGYSWVLQPFSPARVETVGQNGYVPDAAPAGMVGVGGTTVIRLRALQPGAVTLRWLYQQPWMPASTAAQTYDLAIAVVP